ncbi:MAG: response regulator transcription factor [Myxococcales bacterium]|nr:response regulator transcription factor [Myxococcales bacterium]
MRPIRALLVDDEPRARDRLRRLLTSHADVQVVGEASTGEEALEQALSLRPDVVFLDVQMCGMSGTDVAEQLVAYLPESVRPAVVFTTAFSEHAVKAFAVDSLDYLLKPIERDRLAEALRRVRRVAWAQHSTADANAVPPRPAAPAVLTGHHGASQQPVAVGAITAIEMDDGVAWANTVDGGRTRLGDNLAEIEASLPSPAFVRVSRSAIVHVERVERLTPSSSGTWEAVLECGRRVGVSRRRAKHLKDAMGLES